MMSCGGDAQSFSVRGTNAEPTFSEVLGLVAAGMGVSFRKDLSIMRVLRDSTAMDVYTCQEGTLLRDFQGAGGGIRKGESEYGDKCIPRDNSGLKNKIYSKEYLQDAKFDIVLRVADDGLAGRIAAGLGNPVWMLYAGRKACHLTEVPLGGVFETQEDLDAARAGRPSIRKSSQVAPGTPGSVPVRDLPMLLGDNRVTTRYVVQTCP